MLTSQEILGPGGLISRRLKHYEHREEQLAMARAVEEAIAAREHLAVEAGTGVGKSFAYLVPSLLYACAGQAASYSCDVPARDAFPSETNETPQTDPAGKIADSHAAGNDSSFSPEHVNFFAGIPQREIEEAPIPRAVVSTHTISLQEQLIEKDLPYLRGILPMEFVAVLVKGRSNYLCLRRLRNALKKSVSLFTSMQEGELLRIGRWAKETTDGSLADLAPSPRADVWDDVCCETGNCLGSNCLFRDECFYVAARKRIARAQILVVNHSLLFSDLALRIAGQGQGGSILPAYDVLVFDEAHTMEHVAAEHLGLRVSQGQVEYNLHKLFNPRTQKGLLATDECTDGIPLVLDNLSRAEIFFGDLYEWLRERPGGNGRVRQTHIVKNGLSDALRHLCDVLRDCVEKIRNPDQRQEMRAARNRIVELNREIDAWLRQSESDHVYWLETKQGRSTPTITAHSAPVDVGPMLRESLFEKIPSVVMTSATLSTGKSHEKSSVHEGEQAFDFFKSRIGLTQLDTRRLGSPFDYERQATLVLVKGLLAPDAPGPFWTRQLCEMLRRYLTETDGHAFVLFTNYTQLKTVASAMTPWLSERNMRLLSQADGTPRNRLVELFKTHRRSVLFGTDSFWQGVDIPGDALRNVVITKLPFLVPNQPLVEARLEKIAEEGGNPFRDYQLPAAILKFKQGFGRLIRTKSDRGIVVLLDQRIDTKSYGRQFLDALPKCAVRIDRYDRAE